MDYKGYSIKVTETAVMAWPINDEGDRDLTATPEPIQTQTFNGFPDFYYSVIDADKWLVQSFETLEEAKQFIDEETE